MYPISILSLKAIRGLMFLNSYVKKIVPKFKIHAWFLQDHSEVIDCVQLLVGSVSKVFSAAKEVRVNVSCDLSL